MVPIIEASFFYFEQIKNIVYLHIFIEALTDLSKGRPLDHHFECFLVVFMLLGILLTQSLFVVYSLIYSSDIFEVGHSRARCRDEPRVRYKVAFFKV